MTSAIRPLIAPRAPTMEYKYLLILVILNCALDRFDLTTHAPNAIEKLTFLNDCVAHDGHPAEIG